MNLTDMKLEVKRLTGRNDSAFDARIETALNRALVQWTKILPWREGRQVITLTHQGGGEMALPSNVVQCLWVVDATNVTEVQAAKQWDRFYTASLAEGTSGRVFEWEPGGRKPTFTGVSGPLEFYSTAASEIATVYVSGHNAGTSPLDRYEISETISIVGTTPVTTTNSYFDVISICKSAATIGTVHVKSQGTVVARIGASERRADYPWIRLMWAPLNGTRIMCGVQVAPPQLSSAYQAPPPSISTDFLIWAAAGDIFWQLHEGDRAQMAMRRAMDIAKEQRTAEMLFGDSTFQITPEEHD